MELTPTSRWVSSDVELFLLGPEHVSDAYISWLADPEVNQYLESRFQVHDFSATLEYVTAVRRSPGSLFLGIKSVKLDRHVGNIKLSPIDTRHGLGEIGIMIGDREAWGQGIGGRAIDMLTQIARHELGLRKLTAGCYGSNIGSEKAFLKAAFVVEGVREKHFVSGDGFESLILMARYLDSD
jgi:[ribosomal protein S5]-alanine N-acetyltransferase